MDHLRYPVGRFAPKRRPLDAEERRELIDVIEGHPARLRAAVSELDEAQVDTPYRDGGWTVRQLVHHLVDSHLNSYVRFKLAVTEDHPTICTYDQDEWAELADGRTMPVEVSMSILEGLHARWTVFLRSLAPEQFRRTLSHPEAGDITVDHLLELYGWHCPHHEGHITQLRERMGW